MKKVFSFLTATVAMATAACAQPDPGAFSVQPKVGVALSNITNSGTKFREGLAAGAEADYQINRLLNIAGGVVYSQQGAKITSGTGKVNGIDFMASEKLNLQYLNVPILLSVYPFDFGLAFKAGVQPGVLIAKSADINVNGQMEDISVSGEKFSTFDLAVPVGVSYEFDMGVTVDLRYNFGLLDVWENNAAATARNTVAQLTIGYKIPLNSSY